MKKRLLSIITALALCLSLLPATALAASDPVRRFFDISEGKVTIKDGSAGKIKVRYADDGNGQYSETEEFYATETITVTGTSTEDHSLLVSTSTAVTIRASNLHIRHENIACSMAMALETNGVDANAKVTLILDGTNEFYGGREKPGIYVPANSKLTIRGSGSVTATGGSYAAGIGGQAADAGKDCGTIIINGGTVTATGGYNGAGIGGGYNGAGGSVTISGGTVTATGGSNGKGIGAGYNSSSQGTLSTDTNGSAAIFASSIGDQSGKDSSTWSGIIF